MMMENFVSKSNLALDRKFCRASVSNFMKAPETEVSPTFFFREIAGAMNKKQKIEESKRHLLTS